MSERPSAVRFFAPEHPNRPHTVRQHVEQRRAELTSQMASGAARDWPDYRERIGVIRGLTEAIEICRELEKDMDN